MGEGGLELWAWEICECDHLKRVKNSVNYIRWFKRERSSSNMDLDTNKHEFLDPCIQSDRWTFFQFKKIKRKKFVTEAHKTFERQLKINVRV